MGMQRKPDIWRSSVNVKEEASVLLLVCLSVFYAAASLQGTRSRKAIERAGLEERPQETGGKNNKKKRNHRKTLAASVAKLAIHPTAF